MPDQHQALEAFIQKILALQDEPKGPETLSPEECKALALEMGMTEAEWAKLQNEAKDHLKRGRGFLQYQNWNDAVTELRQAMAIQPYSLDVLNDLALAHEKRWKEAGKAEDKDQALKLARRCLQIQPEHQPSLKRISDLQKPPAKQKKSQWIWYGLGLAALILVMVFWPAKEDVPPPPPKPETVTPPPSEFTGDIPVFWKENGKEQGLRLEPEFTEFNDYEIGEEESYSAKLRADLYSESKEISMLKLKYSLLNPEGEVVVSGEQEVIREKSLTVRPGDALALHWDAYKKGEGIPTPDKILVEVIQIQTFPASDSYPESKSVALKWEPAQPSGINIDLRERSFSSRSNSFLSGVFYESEWEYTNTGSQRIELLKLNLRWFDKEGELLKEADHYLVGPQDPLFKPGQRRVSSRTVSVPAKDVGEVARYEVVVAEVDY